MERGYTSLPLLAFRQDAAGSSTIRPSSRRTPGSSFFIWTAFP